MRPPPVHILLIEHDRGREHLLETTIAACGLNTSVRRASGYKEAIAYLSGAARDTDGKRYPAPSLIALDLTLPDGTGLEFLEWLRVHHPKSGIPIVVLTASAEPDELKRSLELGAQACLVRPVTPADLQPLLEAAQSGTPGGRRTLSEPGGRL